MEGPEFLLDPNDVASGEVHQNGSIPHEDLVKYAELTVHTRGRSVINGNTNTFDSTGRSMRVNFLGFDAKTNQYTTNYTDYTPGTPDQDESFGMTEINVKITASHIPVVTITFVDVRGLSLMNQGDNSIYGALLMMPPPIFTLKMKGYYGKAIKMNLHMLKNNIRADSATGNTYITCQFTGTRYAPLADIPIKFITAVPFLEGQEISTTTELQKGKQPASFYEFVQRSRMLLESFGGLSTQNEAIQPILVAEEKLILINEIKEQIIDLKGNYFSGMSSLTVDEEKDNLGVLKNLVISCAESEDFISNSVNNKGYFVEKQILQFKKEIEGMLSSLGKEKFNITYTYKIVESVPRPPMKVYTVSVRGIEIYLDKQSSYYINRKKEKEKEAEDAINQTAITQLGNLPYLGYVYSILCKDIEKFFAMLADVSRDAELHHGVDSVVSAFKGKNRSVENKLETLYPWPVFAEKDENGEMKQQYLGKHPEFQDWPEVQFIEKLANALVNESNKAQEKESRLTSNSDGREKSFIPLGSWNSSMGGINFSPYPEKSLNNIFAVFFRRAVIGMGFGRGFKTNAFSNTRATEAAHFTGVTEGINVASQLKDPHTIQRIRHLADLFLQGGNIDEAFDNMLSAGELDKETLTYYNGKQNIGYIDDPSGVSIFSKRSSPGFKGIEVLLNAGQLNDSVYSHEVSYDKVKGFLSKERNRKTYYGEGYEILEDYNLPILKDRKLNQVKLESSFTDNYRERLLILADEGYREALKEAMGRAEEEDDANILKVICAAVLGLAHKNQRAVKSLWEYGALFDRPGVVEVPMISVMHSGLMVEIMGNDALQMEYSYLLDLLGFSDEDAFGSADVRMVQLLSEADKEMLSSRNGIAIETIMLFINELFNDVDYDDTETATERLAVLLESGQFTLLFEPTYVVNNSYKTFSLDSDDDFYSIKEMKSGLGGIILNGFFSAIKENLKPVKEGNAKESKGSGVDSRVLDNDMKLSLYNQVKSLYDRWVAGNTGDIYQVEDGQGGYQGYFPFIYNTDDKPRLIDSFSFVDKGHHDISNKLIMSLKGFEEWGDHSESSVYFLIRDTLAQNDIHFYPLVNFMRFKDGDWKDSFRLTTDVSDEASASPAFVCIYVGGVSEVLNQGGTHYGSDALDLTDPEDADTFNASATHAFKVVYGKQNQSMFTGLQLNTEEHKETMESITYFQDLMKASVENPSAKAQNLFNIYKQRSYTCGLESLGNMCIQPTQYFQLYNVPMFNGSYIILETETNMNVETINTTARGVRVMKYSVPYVSTYATFMQQRLEEIRLEKGTTKTIEANSNGVEPGSTNDAVAFDVEAYSFTEPKNIQFSLPLLGTDAGKAVVKNLNDFLNTEGGGNFTLGQKGGYCQGWVSRVLSKSGMNLSPYPRSAWHFFAGIDDEVTYLTTLKEVTGKETKISNGDYQKLGVPDGSLLFGYFKGSSHLYESVDVLEGSNKFSNLQHRNLMNAFVNENKLKACPITHVGIWKNGSMYHLVNTGVARDTANMASFTPVAYVPFENIITGKNNVEGSFGFL